MISKMFPLGRVVATASALDLLVASKQPALALIARHAAGDWGEVSQDDARLNDQAIKDGGRILSAYTVGGTRLWVITEADRSSTCILRADEY